MEHRKTLESWHPVLLTKPSHWKQRQCEQTGLFIMQHLTPWSEKFLLFQRSRGSKNKHILKTTLPRSNSARIQTPYQKLMIMVSFCWRMNVLPKKKKKKKKICFINDVLKVNYQGCCILSGPPCIVHLWVLYQISATIRLEIIAATSSQSERIMYWLTNEFVIELSQIAWRCMHTTIHTSLNTDL